MSKKALNFMFVWIISVIFLSISADAKSLKSAGKNSPACPADMVKIDCLDFQLGYMNGVSDRGVGESNVFANTFSTDAYQLGYEKGWKHGQVWE